MAGLHIPMFCLGSFASLVETLVRRRLAEILPIYQRCCADNVSPDRNDHVKAKGLRPPKSCSRLNRSPLAGCGHGSPLRAGRTGQHTVPGGGHGQRPAGVHRGVSGHLLPGGWHAAAADEAHRTVSIDEMTGIQALERAAPGLPMKPGDGDVAPLGVQNVKGIVAASFSRCGDWH